MAYELKKNRFNMFKNNKKNQGDTQPDIRGDMKIECPHCRQEQLYKISAWMSEGKTSKLKYYSGSIQTKEDQSQPENEKNEWNNQF